MRWVSFKARHSLSFLVGVVGGNMSGTHKFTRLVIGKSTFPVTFNTNLDLPY